MKKEEWIDILEAIKSDEQLMKLKITDGYTQKEIVTDSDGRQHNLGGMRAACFTDETNNETTVVFRGTHGAYEWHDNGQGGYLTDTQQQLAALNYINNLPTKYTNLTVTGHSKGGNKSQYVAIMSDRVNECVSFDGQGFSEEFVEKYKDKIDANRHKIKSVSAEGDFVNCLLNPIAGTVSYIATEQQKNFLHNHCPNIMLNIFTDKEGKKHAHMRSDGEQSVISKLINEFSIDISSTLDEPLRSYAINGAIAFLEEKDASESDLQKYTSLLMLATRLDDFAFNQIKEKYGLAAELAATYVMASICPILFIDDLGKTVYEDLKALTPIAIENMKIFGGLIVNKLTQIGSEAAQLTDDIKQSLCKFAEDAKIAWNKLQTYIAGLINDIINDAKAAGVAIDNFVTKATTATVNFFKSVASGVKKFAITLGNNLVTTLDNAVNQASQTVNKIITSAREEVKSKYTSFTTEMKYITNYATETLENLGDKAITSLTNFGKKVLRGMGTYASAQLTVDLARLADLQNKMRSLERYFGERVQYILNDANKVTSDVGRNYSEYYVQQQISSINRTCDEIRQSNRRVCDALQRKVNSLQRALEHYSQIENLLCSEIRG